jgi:iron complex outermembrane receptor protein
MKVYFYALMAMSLITTQINADESSDLNSSDADEIVVTSSILNPSRILNPLYVIDGDEIEDNATTSLGEAIDSYLGVSIADYGAAVGQPIIRGMSGPRVKILKNGMVNRDVSGLGADHLNDIDLNDLQQVEIVKGPSSLLYANGTSGGIINVVDNCIAPEDFTTQEFIAGLETQSVNDGDSQYFNFKDNLNGFNVNVGYKKSEFGNFDIPDDAVMHDEDHEGHDEHEGEEELSYLENSDLEIESTKFGISRAGEWGYVGISVDNHESMYGIPYHGEHSDEEGHDDHDDDHGDEHGDDDHDDDHGDEHADDDHDEHEGERIFSTTDQESFTIKGLYNLNSNLINSVTYNYRDTEYSLTEAHAEEEGHDEHEGEEHEEHAPTVFSNDATEYGAIFDLSNDNFIQKISLNFVDEDSSIVGEEAFMNPANNEEFTIGYFVSADLDMFYLDAGFRLDQIDRTGSVTDEDHGDIDNYSIDDTTNSFALSLGRDLSDTLDVNFGLASVERLPSVIELFMNGPHLATGRLETGNPNLQSETSNNIDITFNYESGDFFAYASFYVNDVDNYITLQDELDGHDDHDDDHGDEHGDDDHDDDHGDEHGDDDHDDHGEFENLIHADYVQEDAEFRGYEFEFGRTFTLGSGDLRLSFGRDDVNAEFSDGHNVPRINPARNIYSLSYVENDWVFKIDLKDVEKQNDIAEGETMTDSYQMLNTRLTKTFNISGAGELKVSIFGSNLLDEAARNHSSFVKKQVPLAGRNYGAKFSYKF